MILLPCPSRPDLDCVASAIAYAEFLTNVKNISAKLWLCGTPDAEAQFYLNLYQNQISFASPSDIKQASGYVLVDYSTTSFFKEPIDNNKVIEVIDHRLFTTPHLEFPHANIQIDAVGAAATLITEYFIQHNTLPSSMSASMLYGAIYTHTLCAQGLLFTDRDRIALDWLSRNFPAAGQAVSNQLAARKQEIINQFPSIILTEMKHEHGTFGPYGISQLEMADGLAFANDHGTAILSCLNQQKHPSFLNLIDLSSNTSHFYMSDGRFGSFIQNHATILEQSEHYICFSPAYMRKQIIPLLNNHPLP